MIYMAAGNSNMWSLESMHPSSVSSSHQHQPSSPTSANLLSSSPLLSPLLFPPHHQYVPPASSMLPFTTLPQAQSWSQLLNINEERFPEGVVQYHQPKKLESWDYQGEDPLNLSSNHLNLWAGGVSVPVANNGGDVVKQNDAADSRTTHSYGHGDPSKEYCVSTSSVNMLDFSKNKAADSRDEQADSSSEGNSTASKKARVSPSTQPPLKVRKEKLGDRISAIHQLVSPFGKTDTASVLLEAIGYIRFLQGQIEALSSPYLGNVKSQHSVQGERNCIFSEDPSKDQHAAKDLRSRGLCLVPVACTQQVGGEINGAEFWAPALGRGF